MDSYFILPLMGHNYHYWFCCSDCPRFGHWELFQVGVYVLLTYLIIFWAFPCSLTLQDVQAHLVLSLTWPWSSCFSPEPGSFHWQQLVGTIWCWLCSWLLGLAAPGPSADRGKACQCPFPLILGGYVLRPPVETSSHGWSQTLSILCFFPYTCIHTYL